MHRYTTRITLPVWFVTIAGGAYGQTPNLAEQKPQPSTITVPAAAERPANATSPSTTTGASAGQATSAGESAARVAVLPPATPPAIEPAPTPRGQEQAVNPEAPLETGPTAIQGKWNPVLYGFAEFDAIHDSTRSFSDVMGNGAIQRPDSLGGHGRTQFGVRNSRLGLRLAVPKIGALRITGIVEMDFLGNQPATPPAANVSESAYYSNPTFRLRHFAMKFDNPYVTVLVGQYWQLFGWQSYFHPASVEIQGVPGQVYGRSPQLRLSHTFKTRLVDLELAAAVARPPQRDAAVPDGHAALRLLVNSWKGLHTMGGTGTAVDAAGLGVSAVGRHFSLPQYTASPQGQRSTNGWGWSIDALLPIVSGTLEDRGNALSVTGSFVTGRGIADLFTGLSTGATASWPLPNPSAAPNPSYVPDIDNGLVELDANGRPHAIAWRGFLCGIQYYLPPRGQLWLALNYSRMNSSNILDYPAEPVRSNLFDRSEWYDANLFWDATVATRLGVEYAHVKQHFGDATTRQNDRAQLSGWLLF